MPKPQLYVPTPHRTPLRDLAALDQGDYKDLLNALEDPDLHIRRWEAVTSLAAVTPLQDDTIDLLLDALVSLRLTATAHSFTLDEVSSAVSQAAELKLEERLQPMLDTRLRECLGTSGVDQRAKMIDIVSSHERLLRSARLVTDLRPIFQENPTEDPRSAIIAHTLRLSFLESGELRTIHLSLSRDLVLQLRDAGDRALSKHETLVGMFADHIDIQEPEDI